MHTGIGGSPEDRHHLGCVTDSRLHLLDTQLPVVSISRNLCLCQSVNRTFQLCLSQLIALFTRLPSLKIVFMWYQLNRCQQKRLRGFHLHPAPIVYLWQTTLDRYWLNPIYRLVSNHIWGYIAETLTPSLDLLQRCPIAGTSDPANTISVVVVVRPACCTLFSEACHICKCCI